MAQSCFPSPGPAGWFKPLRPMRRLRCQDIKPMRSFSRYLTQIVTAAAAGTLLCLVSWAQPTVFRPDRGFLPAGSYSVSDTESVNETNGTVTVRIPLAKAGGRNGAGMTEDLIYNSALYNLQT